MAPEIKKIDCFNLPKSSGAFALEKKPLIFEPCRERFAMLFEQDTQGFFFTHDLTDTLDMRVFISKIEKVINEKHLSCIFATNHKWISWVEPSAFWKSCPIKRSLFTILLRASQSYSAIADNFEDALFSQKYIDLTKNAFIRFLCGFTKYVGPKPKPKSGGTVLSCGWKEIFENKSITEVKKLLISPSNFLYFHGEDFSNSIWI